MPAGPEQPAPLRQQPASQPGKQVSEDAVLQMIGESSGEHVRRRSQSILDAARHAAMVEGLFSENPNQQFAALRALESASSLSAAQYERLCALRSESPHLPIVELAQRLLEEKPHEVPSPFSADTRREVAALVEAVEERIRRRPRPMRSIPLVQLTPWAFGVWVGAAALIGCLGAAVTLWLFSRGAESPAAAAGQVYIDRRSGALVYLDRNPAEAEAGQAVPQNLEPAYYCWKCKQWLPVRNPQRVGDTIEGPRQSLLDRPVRSSGPRPPQMPR